MRISQILLFTVLSTVTVVVNAEGDNKMIHVNIGDVRAIEDLQPIDGITSSGQPDAKEFEIVAKSGYVAVIDMRGPDENRGLDEKTVVENLGLEYVEFPIVGREAISFENAKQLDTLLADIDGPVLLHCGSGNRVGALLALRPSMNGADDAAAMAYGKQRGLTGLEPVVQKRLEET